jgi:hypothetical protein
LRMILLDNYMLLTRDEEQGRLVVISRVSPLSYRMDTGTGLIVAYSPRLPTDPHDRWPAREET